MSNPSIGVGYGSPLATPHRTGFSDKEPMSAAPAPLPIKGPMDKDTLLINWGATLVCGILLVIAFTSWQNEVTLRHLASLGYTKAKVGQIVPLR